MDMQLGLTNSVAKTQDTENRLIQFSRDMVETLDKYFKNYASKGVVNLEANQRGLWLINPANGSRQFLGKATLDGLSTIPTNQF